LEGFLRRIIASLALLCVALGSPYAAELTLDDIFIEGVYDAPEIFNFHWIEDGAAYLTHEEIEDGDHVWTRHASDDGSESEWLRLPAELDDGAAHVEDILLAAGGKTVIVQTDKAARGRYKVLRCMLSPRRMRHRSALCAAAICM
jgi:hypothetical protein